MVQPAARTRQLHSLSSEAGRSSRKRCSSQTLARHVEPWLLKPQRGCSTASRGVWWYTSTMSAPHGVRLPELVPATSGRAYSATESSTQVRL
jgi:hypothetical protein